MKHLFFMIGGALLLILLGIHSAPATVFHHYTATDNGDSCITPQEANGVILAYPEVEMIKIWDHKDDISKMNKWFTSGADDSSFLDKMVVYDVSKLQENTFYVLIFKNNCLIQDVMVTQDEYNKFLKDVFGQEVNFIGHENPFFKGKKGNPI